MARKVTKNQRSQCPDCKVFEGELHDLFCESEACPFCGCQLFACDCCEDMLEKAGYTLPDDDSDTLPENLVQVWVKMLNKKGRMPYIEYPVLCAKCGKIYPDFFKVPDSKWKKYIEPRMRSDVLCKECFSFIVASTDEAKRKRQPNS